MASTESSSSTNVADDYVEIHSSEGHVFHVLREVAEISCTIKLMLNGRFSEAEDGIIRFPSIRTEILEKTIEYMYYNHRHRNSTTPIPEFEIDPELALELLMTANFLQC